MKKTKTFEEGLLGSLDKIKEEFEKQDNELKIASTMLTLAKRYRESGKFAEQLASTVLYAGVAEYIARVILRTIEEEINRKSLHSTFSTLIYIDVKGEDGVRKATNLESSISLLKNYKFAYKKEILSVLEVIVKNRNDAMHKLITANSKGVNIKTSSDNVAKFTENLVDLFNNLDSYIRENLQQQS